MAIRTSATAASSSPRPALTSRRSRISKALYAQILTDEEMVDWLNNTMLLEADMMTEEKVIAHIDNVKNIVEEYYDLVAE